MVTKILILCRGNIVRSPFMAAYLRYLYQNSGLAEKVELQIESSGLEGKPNYSAHPKMLAKGREIGFDLSYHRSRHANMKMIAQADLILVTSMRQYNRLKEYMPHLMYKIYHVYDYGTNTPTSKELDLNDPSQSEKDSAYEEFFNRVIPELDRIWNHIAATYNQCIEKKKIFGPHVLVEKDRYVETNPKKYTTLNKRTFAMCPHCQSHRLKRIKRTGYLQRRVFPLFNGYPYHCGRCKKDFVLFVGPKVNRTYSKSEQVAWQAMLDKEVEDRLSNKKVIRNRRATDKIE